MKLFLFECKKLFKKKTTWAVFVCSIVAVISVYMFRYSAGENIRQETVSAVKREVDNYPIAMKALEEEKKKVEKQGNQPLLESYAFREQGTKNVYKRNKQWLDAYEDGNQKELYQVEIDELNNSFTNFAGSFGYYSDGQEISWFTARATLEELKLLQKNELEPFVQTKRGAYDFAYVPTVYDEFTGSALKEWEKRTDRYATTGVSFLYQMIQHLSIPLFILLGCFLFGNNTSSEMRKKKRGWYFYSVLPVKRMHIYWMKYVSGLLGTLLFVVCIVGFSVVGGLVKGSIGSLDYPVLVYEGSLPNPIDSSFNLLRPREDLFHFIPLHEYVGKVFIFTIVLTIMLYSLYYVVALLVRNASISLLVTGLITFLGMKMTPSAYNPFTYVDIHKVVNGEIVTLTFNQAIHLQNGFISVSLFACLLIVIGYIIFRKIKME